MTELIFFLVCFGASVIGAICGIGGGIIIKPVLDTFGILDVAAISFLSACTVLSMTTYSVINNNRSKASPVNKETTIPLAVGAAVGGLFGKQLFSLVLALTPDSNQAGAVQAGCLTLITVGTLVYTLKKDRIRTKQIKNSLACAGIGLLLGILSSFLGIGGGPMNLVVLFYFFSMPTKTAAANSLYIVFFSQLASVAATVVTGSVPRVSLPLLLLTSAGGILGGICGRKLNRRIKAETVDRLFIALMMVIIVISTYNMFRFVE